MQTHSPERPLVAVAVGAAAAGTLHIAYAIATLGWNIPLAITGGLVGPQVVGTGGAGAYAVGLLLHYGFATAMAGTYYAASRRLRFLSDHWLVCGIFYGMAVYLVMHMIVLPLSALHNPGPYTASDEVVGLVEHMLTVGLPIAYGVRRFAP
jgi:hypothetical protein